MAVYVDIAMHFGWKLYGVPTKNCHLIADTTRELVIFARKVGMKDRWLQKATRTAPEHYDITETKRALAVTLGAIELDRKDFVNKVKELSGRL